MITHQLRGPPMASGNEKVGDATIALWQGQHCEVTSGMMSTLKRSCEMLKHWSCVRGLPVGS